MHAAPEQARGPAADREEVPPQRDFRVDLGAFEGPLDLLLALARAEKIDLTRLSILRLADQYLGFIARARSLHLDLAADYLVMAAWLAFLKSRLLLPDPPAGDEPSGPDLAERLAHRLRRLEAMRQAGARLLAGTLVGRDVFLRGLPEMPAAQARPIWQAGLFDLLSAYAGLKHFSRERAIEVAGRRVWSLAEARDILVRLVGEIADWMPLDSLLAPYLATEERSSLRASALCASLELARDGTIELAQAVAFSPIHLRARPPGPRPRL